MIALPLLCIAAALLAVPGEQVARSRLGALLGAGGRGDDRFAAVVGHAVPALLGLAAALGLGGITGVVVGLALGAGTRVGMRRLGREAIVTPDPLAVAATFDLLAACLRSGLPVASAAHVVAASAPTPVATVLRRAGDLLLLGAEPDVAWAAAAEAPATASLARSARRSARSGAALAHGVGELAAEQRALAEDGAAAAAERAGVLVAGPLGLCFLPAFLCLGVVPVVLGLAGPVLRGGLLG